MVGRGQKAVKRLKKPLKLGRNYENFREYAKSILGY
jgi:hypothetical protein